MLPSHFESNILYFCVVILVWGGGGKERQIEAKIKGKFPPTQKIFVPLTLSPFFMYDKSFQRDSPPQRSQTVILLTQVLLAVLFNVTIYCEFSVFGGQNAANIFKSRHSCLNYCKILKIGSFKAPRTIMGLNFDKFDKCILNGVNFYLLSTSRLVPSVL